MYNLQQNHQNKLCQMLEIECKGWNHWSPKQCTFLDNSFCYVFCYIFLLHLHSTLI
jgi:hypothetical protein